MHEGIFLVDITLTTVTILLFILQLFIWIEFEKWIYARKFCIIPLEELMICHHIFDISKLICVVENLNSA